MPFFQDTKGEVYFFNESVKEPLSFCPEGAVAITDEQAAIATNTPTALEMAKRKQIHGWPCAPVVTGLIDSYNAAIAAPVSFTTAGGMTETFQADPKSINNLSAAIHGCTAAGATPVGFYWVALDNKKVPFTLADLHGLAGAFFNQGAPLFQNFQDKKEAVMAETTVEAVQAVVW